MKNILNKLKSVICANITANTATVNGKKYNVPDGASITIEGDNVTIGSEQVCIRDKVINISIEGSVGACMIGSEQVCIRDKVINISIEGSVGACMTTSGDIHVTGNSGTLQSTSGDITVGGDSMDIRTTSGDVEVGGKVDGNVTTVSGDITHH